MTLSASTILRGLCWAGVASGIVLLQACASIMHANDGTRYSSLDGRRTAVVQQGTVHVDGRAGSQKYDGIMQAGVSFAHDGNRFAYLGMRGSKHFIVVDDTEYGPYDGIASSGLHFSPTGRRIAVAVVVNDRWRMWVDGSTGRDYDGLMAGPPVFSADEAHMAYAARNGKSWFMVVDGVEQAGVDAVLSGGVAFTGNGEACLAFKSKDGWRVRGGNWTSDAFEALNNPGLLTGHPGGTVAYIGRKNGKASVCINDRCDQPFPVVGTLVTVDSGGFGEIFMRSLMWGVVGGVVGGLTGANVPLVAGGPSAGKAIYASVAFSPDGRHHAYTVFDTVPKLVIDNAVVAEFAIGAQVGWMQFDDSSGVLMYRLAGDAALRAVAVPSGAPPGAEVPVPSEASLAVGAAGPGALVFVDRRYVGIAPQKVGVQAGPHQMRLVAPGHLAVESRFDVSPGAEVPVEFNAPPEPARAAVLAAIAALNDSYLPLASKLAPNDVLKLRAVVDIPIQDDVLGYATGSGSGALVFAQSGVYVRNEHSSRDFQSRAYFVPYATLARSPRATSHPAFEVALTPDVEVNVAGMSISKNRLIEFVEALKVRLAQVMEATPPTR